MDVKAKQIPACFRERDQWVLWKSEDRDGKPTKLPYGVGCKLASSTDPLTWLTFDQAFCEYQLGEGWAGIGFVFSHYDKFTGVDLDGCRNPITGEWADWGRKIIAAFNTYTEVSPSGTGAKLYCIGKNPFPTGKNKPVNHAAVSDKTPGIEIYSHSRYFAVTGHRLSGLPTEPADCGPQIAKLCSHYFTPKPKLPKASQSSTLDVAERARRYVAKAEPAVSGAGGHNTTFSVACSLVIGFALDRETAFVLLSEYNARCEPPWSERELWHKIDSAFEQPGERGELV